MPRGKKEQAEQIIPKLREFEVEAGRAKTVEEAKSALGLDRLSELTPPRFLYQCS